MIKNRTIKVCAGIGDNLWLFQKLLNANEQFDFAIADDIPRRAKPFLDLIPASVMGRSYYDDSFGSLDVIQKNLDTNLFSDITDKQFPLTINRHLEAGKRIEEWLPDLKTSYTIPFKTSRYKKMAKDLIGPSKQLIGIYGSSYSTQRAWGFWDDEKWMVMIKKLANRYPEADFVIIGAQFDTDLAYSLRDRMLAADLPVKICVGYPIGVVIEIMKQMNYLLAFASGIPIIATLVGVPNTMYYPDHLDAMRYTWASPEKLEDKSHYPSLYYTPQTSFKHLINNAKIDRFFN